MSNHNQPESHSSHRNYRLLRPIALVCLALLCTLPLAAASQAVNVNTARWITSKDEKKLEEFKNKLRSNLAFDHAGDLAYVAPSRVNLTMTQERWPEIEFLATREHSAYESG